MSTLSWQIVSEQVLSSMPDREKIIITCEHAVNIVPSPYRRHIPKRTLKTHRGMDFGAKEFAAKLARKLKAPLYSAKASRLVVDLNRSLHNKARLFGPFLRSLPDTEKNMILKHHYFPFRQKTETQVSSLIKQKKKVLHISVHSFTPSLRGKVRPNDIGLLMDPKRKREKELALNLKEVLRTLAPEFKVLLNVPYKGTDDGHITYLRKKFPERSYYGLELEINQKYVLRNPAGWQKLQRVLGEAIASVTH